MIAYKLRYLWYLFAGASTVPAFRLGQAWWDEDYRRGGLDRTEGDAELPRHLLVAGLIRHYAPGGSILDVGCGTAALSVPLRAYYAGTHFQYVGVDYSESALRDAATRQGRLDGAQSHAGDIELVRADFDLYRTTEAFDVILFSESLYYAPDPERTVQRYTAALRDRGILVVSMWRRPSRRKIWRALGRVLRERSRCRIVVPRRPAWDIVVYGAR